MGPVYRSTASLGFFGDDLDPLEIAAALDAQPTAGLRVKSTEPMAGDAERPPKPGSWRLVGERRGPGDLDNQINDLLDALSDNLVAWRSLCQRYRGRVFCGLFLASGNEGLTLRSETLARLSERGLVLDLDIYGSDGVE